MKRNPTSPLNLSVLTLLVSVVASTVLTPDASANIFDKLKKQIEKAAEDLASGDDLKKEVEKLIDPNKEEKPEEDVRPANPTAQQGENSQTVASQSSPQPNESVKGGSVPDDEALMWSRQEYFFEQPAYFDSMPFDFGEYRKIPSVDESTFSPLYVSTHKGLPRLGVLPNILTGNPTTHYSQSDRNRKRVVAARLKRDNAVYFNLALLDLMEEEATAENIKVDNSGEPANRQKTARDIYSSLDELYRPRYHIQSLAAGLLTPKGYESYFAQPADSVSAKSPNRSTISWGGSNPFAARRSFHSFVDEEVPKLKKWSKEIGRNVYVVGSEYVDSYDFKRKGIELTLRPPKFEEYVMRHYSGPDEKILNADGTHKVLLTMESGEAERILEKTKFIYFAIEGELIGIGRGARSGGPYSATNPGTGIEYEITGDTIEVYADELLTQKLCSFDPYTDKVVAIGAGSAGGSSQVSEVRVATPAPGKPASAKGGAGTGGRAGYSDSGNFRTFTAPGSSIKPLTIPVYKGKLCPDLPVALVNRNSPEYSKLGSKERSEALALFNEIRRSVKFFNLLRNMKIAREYYNPEWLKENFDMKRVPGYGTQMHMASWFDLAKELAVEGLTEESLPQYFCTDGKCQPNELRRSAFWGGTRPMSQFAARRAFGEFIDNEMPNFLAWSDQIDFEAPIVLVGTTRASDYLFDLGGYVFDLSPISGIHGSSEKFSDLSVFKRRSFANRVAGTVLWEVGEDQAEAVYNRTNRKQLYYIYEVTLKFSEKSYLSGTYDVSVKNIQYDQELATDSIQVFTESKLEDHLVTFPIQ